MASIEEYVQNLRHEMQDMNDLARKVRELEAKTEGLQSVIDYNVMMENIEDPESEV